MDTQKLHFVGNPFAEMMGIKLEECRDGTCVASIDVRDEHFHPGGVVHGGVAFSLADSCMAMALISILANGKTCLTIESKISYLSGVTSGTLRATATIVKQGHKIAFLEVDVSEGDRTCVVARYASMISPGPGRNSRSPPPDPLVSRQRRTRSLPRS